jgi:hypothetical protein
MELRTLTTRLRNCFGRISYKPPVRSVSIHKGRRTLFVWFFDWLIEYPPAKLIGKEQEFAKEED